MNEQPYTVTELVEKIEELENDQPTAYLRALLIIARLLVMILLRPM